MPTTSSSTTPKPDKKVKAVPSKNVFQLDTPYTEVTWPAIDKKVEAIIVDFLVSFLSPIGVYRNLHVEISKGKRSKKRKRREQALAKATTTSIPELEKPSPPDLSSYVSVGVASITRALEATCEATSLHDVGRCDGETTQTTSRISTVFVSMASKNSVLAAHFPRLVAAASRSGSENPIKLVLLPRVAEEKLCAAMGINRAGFVAVHEGAPHGGQLLEYVHANVADIEVPWIDQANKKQYLPLKVISTKASVGLSKKVQREQRDKQTKMS